MPSCKMSRITASRTLIVCADYSTLSPSHSYTLCVLDSAAYLRITVKTLKARQAKTSNYHRIKGFSDLIYNERNFSKYFLTFIMLK